MNISPKFKTFAATATATSCNHCSVKTVIDETKFIDKLQSLVEYGNSHVLHSFKIRLQMEDLGGSTE